MPTHEPLSESNADAPTAAEWLARRHSGSYGAADQRAFMQWLNASVENHMAYAEAERLWEEMRALDTIASAQLAEARAFMERQQQRKRRCYALFASAAAVLLSLVLWQGHFAPDSYRTAVGEQRSIELADGSRLDLNTDSEAVVRYSSHERAIDLLRGQAIFTVAHGDARQFNVHAGGAVIRDIGTRFDVRLQETTAMVAVLDGEIEISGDGRTLALQRGQGVSYARSGRLGSLQAVDVERLSAWRDGKLLFRAEALAEVIEELQRYHRATILIGDPGLMKIRVSGVFPTNDLPLALQTIAATLPVTLQQTGSDNWLIKGR
ncbi:MAG: FecR family protein [Azonexus sp.]|nr:FecR family protein [Azonexus sp.]